MYIAFVQYTYVHVLYLVLLWQVFVSLDVSSVVVPSAEARSPVSEQAHELY